MQINRECIFFFEKVFVYDWSKMINIILNKLYKIIKNHYELYIHSYQNYYDYTMDLLNP